MAAIGERSSLLTVSSAYASLFAASGLLISAYVTLDINERLRGNDGMFPLSTAFLCCYALIVLVSAYHQFQIYNGFHQIESDEDGWSEKTGGWAGSRRERIFRFSILFVILGAFAKGGPVFDLIVLISKIPCTSLACFGTPEFVNDVNLWRGPEYKSRIFLTLISLTFFLFLIWEFVALSRISKIPDSTEKEANKKEIWKWVQSDALALVIWLSLSLILIFDFPDWVFLIPTVLMLEYTRVIWKRYGR